MDSKLEKQIHFILEADRLKTVLRQTFLTDRSRQENSAEHSWHLILMAQILSEYLPSGLDHGKLAGLLAVHDLVEIIVGDTFAYDGSSHDEKSAKEDLAARKLFTTLPDSQAKEFYNLWREFEDGVSAESRAAWVIDRLQPFILNCHTEGASWKKHGVRRSQIEKRMAPVGNMSPKLGDFVRKKLEEAIQKGWVKPD